MFDLSLQVAPRMTVGLRAPEEADTDPDCALTPIARVIDMMANSDAVIRSRYLEIGAFRWPTIDALDRTCKRLGFRVRAALKKVEPNEAHRYAGGSQSALYLVRLGLLLAGAIWAGALGVRY